MIDKIDISCKCFLGDFEQIFDYCKFRNIRLRVGSGYKFFKEKSILTDYFQIFYTVYDNEVDVYCSIGSEYSNRYGVYLLKRLFLLGVYDIRIVRIDFCYDLKGYYSKDNKNVCDWKITPFVINKKPHTARPQIKVYRNKSNNKFIDTSYVISNYFKIRMYDKGVEQHLVPYNSDWKRFEVELKRQLIFRYIDFDFLDFNKFSVREIEKKYRSLIKFIYDKYEFNQKYQRLLKKLIEFGDERLKRIYVKNDLMNTLDWFKKTYDIYVKFYVATNPEKFKNIVESPEAQAEVINEFYYYWSKRG